LEIFKADNERSSGHPESAMVTCRKWLADPSFDPAKFGKNTAEYLAGLMVRGEAQRCLAQSLEASGKYEEAIAAYTDCTTKHPIPSFCGNAHAEQDVFSKLGQGRCQERLGRHQEAIDAYFQATSNNHLCSVVAPVLRMVEIYETAGKLDRLRDYLRRRDLWYVDQQSMEGHKFPDLQDIEQSLPSRAFKPVLSFAAAEREANWGELIEAISGRWRIRDDRIAACRRLARHASLTEPLLRAELAKGLEGRGWVAYTLGMCGGKDAVTALQRAIPPDAYGLDVHLLLRGLDRAGESGRIALRELQAANPGLKSDVTDVYEKSATFPYDWTLYPPIPKNIKLD
jgi:tetratricopeptide (TPR) repeat protein